MCLVCEECSRVSEAAEFWDVTEFLEKDFATFYLLQCQILLHSGMFHLFLDISFIFTHMLFLLRFFK